MAPGFISAGVISVASLLVRVAAIVFWGMDPIEGEEAEYARIAENLLRGVGNVRIASPGTELIFSPLSPLLISGVGCTACVVSLLK